MSKALGAVAFLGAGVLLYKLFQSQEKLSNEFAAEQNAALYEAQIKAKQQKKQQFLNPPQQSGNPWAPVISWGLGEIMNGVNSNKSSGGGFWDNLFGRKKGETQPEQRNRTNLDTRPTTTANAPTTAPQGRSGGWFDNGLPPSVIGTESGGNTGAYNNVKGAGGHYGHGGRGQFGTARLRDAYNAGALDRPMTAAEFAKQPLHVQQRVEQWHVQDIGNYIERNNLDVYIGQTVNGVKVTPNGMIAAAHLGGSGGLKKWLKTGRNPSDAFGTSLTDYMRKHEGYG